MTATRIAIIGNSGSGKTTLAARLAAERDAEVLDLDTIHWQPGKVAVARDPADALADLRAFCDARERWIVEGCYENLIGEALSLGAELILVEPGVEACLRNCRNRPWEPHKYASREEQDAKLEFLLRWVADYYVREGPMSFKTHRALYEAHAGPKRLCA